MYSPHTSDNSHYERVRNGRFNMKRLFIQSFQFLVVFLRCVHLDLQSIDLQQLRAFLQVILSIICLLVIIIMITPLTLQHKNPPVIVVHVANQENVFFHFDLTTWHDWWSCLRIFCSFPYSSLSKYNFPSCTGETAQEECVSVGAAFVNVTSKTTRNRCVPTFVLVLNHSLSFLASFKASNVVS